MQHAVDALSLMWHSDLVISGGGTMNREAAAMGVPVYSIFLGETGAVDRHLSEIGRLILVKNYDDFRNKIRIEKRTRRQSLLRNIASLESIVQSTQQIMDIEKRSRQQSLLINKADLESSVQSTQQIIDHK